MVTERKVAKKKTASRKKNPATSKRVSAVAPKKKGVAVKPKPKAGSATIELSGSIVISNVMEWQKKMSEVLSSKDAVVLDGGEVEQIDGPGLQLLVALMKEAATSNTSITWKSASDVLRNNAAQLGLTEILSLSGLSESE